MTVHYSEVYQKYGKIISEFSGNGELIFDNSKKYSCEFCLFQLSDGSTYFSIEKLPSGTTYTLSDVNRKFSFKGITDSGLITTIQLEDSDSIRSFFPPLMYRIHQFKIIRINLNQIKGIKFCITNFLFTGNNSEKDTLSLQLPGEGSILIKKVVDYSDKERLLKDQVSIDITSELFISLDNPNEIARAIRLAHDICCLLSIGRGSRVSWINYTVYDERDELMHQVFCPLTTRPLSGMPELISSESRGVDSTKYFLESAYLTISKNNHLKKSLLKFCNVFNEARDGRGFTELRSVKIAVLMEMLKEYTLVNPEFEISREILNSPKQKPVKDQILKQCKEVITKQIESIDDIKYANRWCLPSKDIIDNHYKLEEDRLCLNGNLLGLNHTNFKKIVDRLCEKLEVPVTPQEIQKFVKSRNSLIHTGNFFCESQECNLDDATWKEYQFLVNFLDKVFLKLFGYSGKYDNFLKWGHDLEDKI